MSPRPVRYLGAGLIAVALLGAAPPKGEAPPKRDRETVQVSVIAIIATERDDKIDPKLACIAREVRKSNKKLTGFQIRTMTSKSLAVGVKGSFQLVADQTAGITVQKGADENNHIELKVNPPQMGEITYDTCCGKFLPIFTPYRTKNKDLLIIAVRVQPCHDK